MIATQTDFLNSGRNHKEFKPILTATLNKKGVMDVDTVKGCELGMKAYPTAGCYGSCYACSIASRYGRDFTTSVPRAMGKRTFIDVFFAVKNHKATWYRVGTMGDPSHDWEHTVSVCEALESTGKTPVIITKHWRTLSDGQLARLARLEVVINTSTSGMDTDAEIEYRLEQMDRIETAGIKSVCRVVTCLYGQTAWGESCNEKQNFLLSLSPVIDTPLRTSKSNKHVKNGDILITRCDAAIGGGKLISLHSHKIYLGHCDKCPDQCGAVPAINKKESK